MPGATPIYGLPYPIGTDRLDDAVTTIPEDLATQLETTLSSFGGVVGPSAWTAMPWATNWSQPAGFTGMRGYSKVGTRVDLSAYALRSTSTSTANAAVATLPVGYRPPGTVIWPTVRSDTGATLFCKVESNGVVSFNVAIPAGVNVPIHGYFYL